MTRLSQELRHCGLERMAREAEAGTYDDDQHKLIEDLRFALGLKSLTMREVGLIGRLHKRALDGDFHPTKSEPPVGR